MNLAEAKSHFDIEEIDPLIVFYHIDANINHLSGPTDISCDDTDCILLVRVKDGEPYIHEFMDHYLNKLKVKHIFFLDNGSSDNTVSLLKSYDNVSLFATSLPFKIFQHAFSQYLVWKFGKERWSLSADIDEFFDYPFSEVLPLKGLIEYLNQNNYNVVITQMLDLFSHHDLTRVHLNEKNFRKVHVYYDLEGLRREEYLTPKWKYKMTNQLLNPSIKFFSGGIRNLIFDLSKVWLTKHPLMFFSGSMTFPHCHLVLNARAADIPCVFYHYKFLGHFLNYVHDAVKYEYHDNNSMEYKQYMKKIQKDKELKLVQSSSRVLEGQEELLRSEFIVASDEYLRWIVDHVLKNHDSGSAENEILPEPLCKYTLALISAFNKENDFLDKMLEQRNEKLNDLRQKVEQLKCENRELRSKIPSKKRNRLVKSFLRNVNLNKIFNNY
jgi:hypothetical protein